MRNRERYHPDWNDVIRPDILKRDKFVCVKCGVMHKKSYVFQKDGSRFRISESEIKEWRGYGDKAYKVFLQIVHLDRDPGNNDYDNLKAYCPKCHLNYDREVNMILRKTKSKRL